MKKKFLIFALMLIAVGISFTVVSCSSDDDDNVVQEAAATEEVKAFFEKDFSTNYSDIYQKSGFFTVEEYMYLSNVIVRTINSRKEFEQAYNGKYKLPDIDFSQNTLLVGMVNGYNSGETLGAVRLLNTEGDYELQVVINKNVHPERVYSLVITPLFFWKIYPKFPTSNMKATRIVKEVIY